METPPAGIQNREGNNVTIRQASILLAELPASMQDEGLWMPEDGKRKGELITGFDVVPGGGVCVSVRVAPTVAPKLRTAGRLARLREARMQRRINAVWRGD